MIFISCFCIFVVVDTDQQNFALSILQYCRIFFLHDLFDGSLCIDIFLLFLGMFYPAQIIIELGNRKVDGASLWRINEPLMDERGSDGGNTLL